MSNPIVAKSGDGDDFIRAISLRPSVISRVLGEPFVPPLALAAAADDRLSYGYGQYLGLRLAARGFTAVTGLVFGIDDSTVLGFGDNPYLAGRIGHEFLKGLLEKGVVPFAYLDASSDVDRSVAELDSGLFLALRMALYGNSAGIIVPDHAFTAIDSGPADQSASFIYGVVRGMIRCTGPVAAMSMPGLQTGSTGLDIIFKDDPAGWVHCSAKSSSTDVGTGLPQRIVEKPLTLLRDNMGVPVSDQEDAFVLRLGPVPE